MPRAAARGAHSATHSSISSRERVRVEIQRAILAEAQQLLDDAVRLVDAGEDAGRVLARGAGSAPRAEQVRVHADGAVVARHLVEHRRRRLADGGEALAAIELVLRGDQLLAAALALEAGVVQALQDRVQGERGAGSRSRSPSGRRVPGPPRGSPPSRRAAGASTSGMSGPSASAMRVHVRAGAMRPGIGATYRQATVSSRRSGWCRERQAHGAAGRDRRHAHGVLAERERVADVAVGDAVERERLAAPASGRFRGEPDGGHDPGGVEEHDEREARAAPPPRTPAGWRGRARTRRRRWSTSPACRPRRPRVSRMQNGHSSASTASHQHVARASAPARSRAARPRRAGCGPSAARTTGRRAARP